MILLASKLTFILSYFYRVTRVIPFSGTYIKFSLKAVYPTMVGEIFKFMLLRLLEKSIYKSKKMNFCSCSQGKIPPPPLFIFITPRWREITRSPHRQPFFQNLFPQQKDGKGNFGLTTFNSLSIFNLFTANYS